MSNRIQFTNAVLLDGVHPAKPDTTIVVAFDRIDTVATGPVEVLPGDQVIDCAGRTVMPGMVSGHFHSTYHNITAALIPPLGLESPPAYQALIAAHNARIAIEAGVTSVVGANETCDVDPSLAQAIEDGLIPGPRVIPGSRELITTGDSTDSVPWWYEAQALGGARICNSPDEFRRAARDEIKRGAQIIKLFASGGHGVRHSADISSITRDEMSAAIEAAHGLGKRVRAHVAGKPAIMRCIELGVDILDHADGLDDECIAGCVENGTIVLPSLHAVILGLRLRSGDDPDTMFENERGQLFLEMCEILPAAVEAGVTICLGDDYGGAFIPHGIYGQELGILAEYTQVPVLELIRWATVNGGVLVGRDDLGSISEGSLADLLVVDGDPLADIGVLADQGKIHVVMRDGEICVDRRPAAV